MQDHTFYVREADSFTETTIRAIPIIGADYALGLSDQEAIQLTLQKWTFIEEALVERKQMIAEGRLYDDEWELAHGGIVTCALCMKYLMNASRTGSCDNCPVGIAYAVECEVPEYIAYLDAENIDDAIVAAQGCKDLLQRLLDNAG